MNPLTFVIAAFGVLICFGFWLALVWVIDFLDYEFDLGLDDWLFIALCLLSAVPAFAPFIWMVST